MKTLLLLLAGILFGLGIAVSGMINPAKVLNFFDVAGTWDPSLAFVMLGGVTTAFLGYRWLFASREIPWFGTTFHAPISSHVDAQLLAGSALFGVGWGLSGFCPGGSIPALGLGQVQAFAFVAALMAGIATARLLQRKIQIAATRPKPAANGS